MIKKKIKDLSIVEIENICDKQPVCNNCPLDVPFSPPTRKYCMKFIIDIYKKYLEKEIEVEE